MRINPFPGHGFFGIGVGIVVVETQEYVVEFLLGEFVVEFCTVDERKYFFELGVKAHFFFEAAVSRGFVVFVGSGVGAYGIGPESS